MKEEIARITKLVAEGKLSPDQAAELIDAFTADARATQEPTFDEEPAPQAETVPPGPQAGTIPPRQNAGTIEGEVKDAFRSVVEQIERLGKEAQEVDWKGVADKARNEAKRGFQGLRGGIEDLTKGKLDLGNLNLGALFNEATREVELPFTLPAGKPLRIENECGDIEVTGGDVLAEVRASVRIRAANVEEARRLVSLYTLAVEESDGSVTIRQPHQPGLTVRLVVTLPEASLVEARADTGDVTLRETRGAARVTTRTGRITVHGCEGAVEARSETGVVTLSHISAPVTAETRSASIVLEGIRGDLKVATASGNVNARGFAGGGASVEAVAGNVAVEFIEPPEHSVELSTVSGNVLVGLPGTGSYNVVLSALRGEVRTDLPLEELQRTPQKVTGRIGEGATRISASSVAGNVEGRLAV